ncbi:MAG: LAETG motif-containing sortase-dependent surface protein [Candidatus Methylomirabilales bacterium]
MGADGKQGPVGKKGLSKTVIVQSDGTSQVVDDLPATGSDHSTPWAAGIGIALISLGTATTVAIRRRK